MVAADDGALLERSAESHWLLGAVDGLRRLTSAAFKLRITYQPA
jgi:hypothetical protein